MDFQKGGWRGGGGGGGGRTVSLNVEAIVVYTLTLNFLMSAVKTLNSKTFFSKDFDRKQLNFALQIQTLKAILILD